MDQLTRALELSEKVGQTDRQTDKQVDKNVLNDLGTVGNTFRTMKKTFEIKRLCDQPMV